MGEKSEVDYEKMGQFAKKFNSEADSINQLLAAMSGQAEHLSSQDWIGKGSDKFRDEMNDLVIPAMKRLVEALNAAGAVSDAIAKIYRNAEDQANGVIKMVGE